MKCCFPIFLLFRVYQFSLFLYFCNSSLLWISVFSNFLFFRIYQFSLFLCSRVFAYSVFYGFSCFLIFCLFPAFIPKRPKLLGRRVDNRKRVFSEEKWKYDSQSKVQFRNSLSNASAESTCARKRKKMLSKIHQFCFFPGISVICTETIKISLDSHRFFSNFLGFRNEYFWNFQKMIFEKLEKSYYSKLVEK